MTFNLDDKEMFRADGRAKCPICLLEYRVHPQADPENCPTLLETCDGRLVKI